MTTITWNGGTGDFNTGSFWSGGTAPGAGDVAVVDAGSGASAILLDASDNLAGLTLDDPAATLTVTGTLGLGSGVLDAAAGSLVIDGTLSGGTLVTAGAAIALSGVLTTFDDVTVQGTLALAPGDTLTASGIARTSLQAITLGAGSELLLVDAEDFQGQTIELGGGVLGDDNADPNDGSIFFGPDTVVRQDAAGTTARIGPDVFSSLYGLGQVVNESTIIVTAGTLDLDSEGGAFDSSLQLGPFTNAGTIEIGAGTTVVDDTNAANLAGLGTIINTGGLLDLKGTLNNAGTTIDVAASGEFSDLQLDGTVEGGTILETGGTLVEGTAALVGVTIDGPGMGFVSFLTIGKNTAFNPGGGGFALTTLRDSYGQLTLADGAVLANTTFGIGADSDRAAISVAYAGTATLAATTTINVASGQFMAINYTSDGTLIDDAVYNVAAGGDLQFGSATSYTAGATINVVPAATIALDGNIGLAALGNVVGSGATLVNKGLLDLGGGTITTAGNSHFAYFLNPGEVTDGTLVTVAGQNPNLGLIDGGTLVTGAGVLQINDVSLANATLQGAVQLMVNGILAITGNTRLTNSAGTGPGTIIINKQPQIYVLGSATSLQFNQSATLSGATVLLSGVTTAQLSGAFSADPDINAQYGSTATFGPDTMIVATTVNGPISGFGNQGFFVNQGTIAVDPGADFFIVPYGSRTQQDFTNDGSITIAAGGTLDVATNVGIAALGAITGTGGLLRLDDNDVGNMPYDNTGNTLTLGGGAPDLELDGGAVAGGTIVNAGGKFTSINFSTLDGVTYVGALHLTSGSDIYGNITPGGLYFSGGTLDSQAVTVDPGAELALSGNENFVGARIALSGELADTGNTLGFDAATVVTVNGNVYLPAGNILNAGTIIVAAGGSLDMNDFGATTTAEPTEAGSIVLAASAFATNVLDSGQTVELGPDSTLGVSSRFDSGSVVDFQAPNTLKISSYATFDGSVANFGVGDTIDLSGYQNGVYFGNTPTITLSYAGNTLSVISNGTVTIDAIPIGPGYDPAGFSLSEGAAAPFIITDYDITYTPPGQPAPTGPVLSGTGPSATTDTQPVQPFGSIDLSDADGTAVVTAVVTQYEGNGALTAPSGGTLTPDGLTWVDTGTPAAVQAALRGLVFTPIPHQTAPGAAVTTDFGITVSDQSASLTDNATSVAATAVEDALDLSGVTPITYSAIPGGSQPFHQVGISDPDQATFTATVTLSNTADAAFGHSYAATISAGGVFSASGNLSTVTQALQNLIIYPSAAAGTPTGQTITTGVSLSLSDGLTQTVEASSTLVAVTTGTADATGLQIIGTQPDQATSDRSPISPFAGAIVVDHSIGTLDTLTIVMSDPADGSFSDALGGTINGGTFTVSATVDSSGFVSGIDTPLEALVFTPTIGQAAAGQTVTTSFPATASNSLGTATDAATSVIATSTGAQLLLSGAQPDQELTDDTRIDPLSGVTITDTQIAPAETATVRLSNPQSGVLTAGNSGTVGGDGVFRVSGDPAQVQGALQSLGFTPAPTGAGQLVTSGVTISVADGALNATDTTTSLDVIGSGAPSSGPVISGASAGQATPDEVAIAPFAGVVLSDPGGNGTLTATVTLSAPADFTLSNLGGGSYAAGIYDLTGTPGAAGTALDGLQFTPVAPAPGIYVTTTGFSIAAQGQDGTTSNTATSVSAVQQVLGLAAVATSDLAFSVSPDGGSFAAATAGKTNEAVVTAPSAGDIYQLPAGYQAEYLGGTANAELQDNSVGNAVLVGNAGADTIAAAAANDSLVGGSGSNLFDYGPGAFVVSRGSDTLVGSTGNATVVALAGATDSTGTGSQLFVGGGSSVQTVNEGAGSDVTAFTSGGGDVINGNTATGGSLLIVGGGGADTITGNASNVIMFGSQAGDVVGFGPVARGSNYYIGSGGAATVTADSAGGGTDHAGSLYLVPGSDIALDGTGSGNFIAFGSGAETLNAGGSFGGDLYQPGAGDETINMGDQVGYDFVNFFKTVTAGDTYRISNYVTTDTLQFIGYAGPVQQTQANGSTIFTLSDNSVVTLLNFTGTAQVNDYHT